MQIIEIEVTDTAAHDGKHILRVVFRSEGDECVTVDMATSAMGEEEAVERARAVLVQTATFGAAENQYDTNSNGNFDEIVVTSASDEEGSVYVFEYRDGGGSREVPPTIMPSVEAAREEAIRSAMDLLADPAALDIKGWLVRVRDCNGDLICSVDAEDAELARQKTQ